MNYLLRLLVILTIVTSTVVYAADPSTSKISLDDYNVSWSTPSNDSSGSMPLGNGDIGLNVWAEADGDLLFYIGKTDAFSGIGRLLKLGQVRVKLTPNPFGKGMPFQQTLRLRQGCIDLVAGKAESKVRLKVWVDANRPVIHVDFDSRKPISVEATYESWRKKPRLISSETERYSARGIFGVGIPTIVEPDTIVDEKTDRIVFYHRNNTSIWPPTMKHQALGHMAKPENDPLMHRTFGGLLQGKGFVKVDETKLRSAAPATQQGFSITVKTAITQTAAQWIADLEELASQCQKTDSQTALAEHEKWWDAFWNRSYIFVSPAASEKDSEKPQIVTRGYLLQRFISACSGRGDMPIKFNGSIFTVDAIDKDERFDADYRRWGGCYWWQNTRLPYWAMLESGDFDMMQPLFDMYVKGLPLSKQRVKTYFKHDGAYFPETMYFWGTPTNHDYSFRCPDMQRGDAVDGDLLNPYIRYYWSGGIEMCTMALDLYDFQQDRKFLDETLLPLAVPIIEFYDSHYDRDENGKIRFAPAASLETYHVAENPLPEIAGLKTLLRRMLQLPQDATTEKQRSAWRRLATELPPLPLKTENGKTRVIPAEKYSVYANSENPGLYSVFPYRVYGLGKPDIEIGIETFNQRRTKEAHSWRQDGVQAAYLGLTDEAKKFMSANFEDLNAEARFPAFWAPHNDWVPDQCHGCVAMMALQSMLIQSDGDKILLLPAWPKEWDVEFKLNAAKNTTVEGVYRDGKLQSLCVTPKNREKDVVLSKSE
jgi:uncharacterized protein DUF5703/glycosyl hydrolase family 95